MLTKGRSGCPEGVKGICMQGSLLIEISKNKNGLNEGVLFLSTESVENFYITTQSVSITPQKKKVFTSLPVFWSVTIVK